MKSVILAAKVSMVLFASAAIAQQQPPESYEIEMARAQLNLVCTVSEADGGSADCDINFSSRGKHVVTMSANEGQGKGFTGADIIGTQTSKNVLVVSADAGKSIQGVALLRMESSEDGKAHSVAMSVAQTNSVVAANIDPLNIELTDEQTAKITLSMTAYGPANTLNMVSSFNKTELTDFAIEKVKPAIAVARASQRK